jgi:hypothetical protein
MARGKRHNPEQIVNVLRQIEVAIANGKTTAAAVVEELLDLGSHREPIRNPAELATL